MQVASILRKPLRTGALVAANTMDSLQQAQATAKSTSESVETKTESDINVFENRVELFVLDKAAFDGKLAREGIILPSAVHTIEVSEFSKQEDNV